jgi:hypothetical protein
LLSYLGQNYPETRNIYFWTENPWIYYLGEYKSPTRFLTAYDASKHWTEAGPDLSNKQPDIIVIDSTATDPANIRDFLNKNYEGEIEFDIFIIYFSESSDLSSNVSQ